MVGADDCSAESDPKYGVGKGGREGNRVKQLGMYGAFFSMPRGKTDSMWRRWFHAPGRRAIMVRPDEQRDRATVFMYVVNEKDKRLGGGRFKGT